MPAPDGKALAGPLFEVAAPHNGPARVAREYTPSGLGLVVKIDHASKPGESSRDVDLHLDLPRVDVCPVARRPPAAREHQARAGRRKVEDRLRSAGRVLLHPPRHEHDEHAIATRHGASDHLGIVRAPARSRSALEAASFATLCSRQTATTSQPRSSACSTMSLPVAGRPDDANPHGTLQRAPSIEHRGQCCAAPMLRGVGEAPARASKPPSAPGSRSCLDPRVVPAVRSPTADVRAHRWTRRASLTGRES